jgi:hypothetical protein
LKYQSHTEGYVYLLKGRTVIDVNYTMS